MLQSDYLNQLLPEVALAWYDKGGLIKGEAEKKQSINNDQH